MATYKQVGLLLIGILATSIYVSLPESTKLQIGASSSTFSVWESSLLYPNGSWVKGGVEYNKLYNGSKLISAVGNTSIKNSVSKDNTTIIIVRARDYTSKTRIVDTYTFLGNETSRERFPVEHQIEIFNGNGLIYQYEVGGLFYNGSSRDAISPESFGHNMRVEWQDGAYYKKIIKSLTSTKLLVKYRIDSDYMRFNNRLFDPPAYSKQNFFTQLYWNRADLTFGEASFQFCNPTSVSLPFNRDKLSLLFMRNHGEIRDVSLSYLKTSNTTISENVWIANVSIVKRNVSIIDNVTGLNITTFFNESRDTGWYKSVNKTIIIQTYLPVPAVANIPAGKCFDVLLRADWNPAYRENRVEVDWIPKYAVGTTSFMREEWSWWNTSWISRKPITINGSSSALTDYQVQINLNWTSGMNATCSDFRFTDNSTNGVLLPHWTENCTASTNATVWIKTNLTAGSNTVYLYYNNSVALDASNISTTMIFGDDFNRADGAIGNGWTVGTGGANVLNNQLNFTNAATGYGRISIPYTGANTSIAIHAKAKQNANWWIGINYKATSTDNDMTGALGGRLGFAVPDVTITDNNVHKTTVAFAFNASKWYNWQYAVSAGYVINLTVWEDGSSKPNSPTLNFGAFTPVATGNNIRLGINDGSTPTTYYVDDVFVRQYIYPEPVVLSIGAEEGQPVNTLYLNLTTSNKTYEQYNTVGIYANSTSSTESLCLSSSHPRKGSLYKCGTGNVSDTWIANNTQNLWSNNQTSWTQSLSSGGSLTFNLTMDKYANAKGIWVNVSGYTNTTSLNIFQGFVSICSAFWGGGACENINDSSLTTFGRATGTGSTATRYDNFTNDNYVSGIWEIKVNNAGTLQNSSIPTSCLNTTIFEEYIISSTVIPTGGSRFFCKDSSGAWITVRDSYGNTDDASIYMSRFYFNKLSNPQNVSIDFLSDGTIDKQTIGDYINNTIRLSWFNDSQISKSVQFNTTDQYTIYYLRMPKSWINITSAKVDVNTTLTASSNFTMKCTDSGVSCSASPNFACSSGSASNIIDGDYTTGCGGTFWGSCNPTQIDVSFNFSARATAYSLGTYSKLFYNSSWDNPNYGTYRQLLLNSSNGNYVDFLNTGGDSTIRNYVTTNVLHFTNGTNNVINWRFNDTGVGYTGPQWITCNGVNELSFIIEAAQSANYSLDIGFDGSIEHNELRLASGVTQANFSQGLSNYLANCTADTLGVCTVPVYYSSKVPMSGVLQNLEINYTINPLSLSSSALNVYLANNCTGTAANTTCNIPTRISSSTAGNITANYMLDYEGFGSYQWNLTDATGATVYDSRTVNVSYSKYNISYPNRNINSVNFIGTTNESKNISAYGQTTSIGILNITMQNYKNSMNISIKLNETPSCINVTISDDSSKANGTILTTNFLNILTNKAFNYNAYAWAWADYNCNASLSRYYRPQFVYQTKCVECW